jgi:hypothetical protein
VKQLLPLLVAFSLAAAAGRSAAQSPAAASPPSQQPAAPASQPAERKPLILHLDDASRRQIMFGPGGNQSAEGASRGSDSLPSLGGDARRVDPAQLRDRSSPYPKESTSPIQPY